MSVMNLLRETLRQRGLLTREEEIKERTNEENARPLSIVCAASLIVATLVSLLLYHGQGVDLYAWAVLTLWCTGVMAAVNLVLGTFYMCVTYTSKAGRMTIALVLSVVGNGIVAANFAHLPLVTTMWISFLGFAAQIGYAAIAAIYTTFGSTLNVIADLDK